MTIQPRLVRLLRDNEYERHDDFIARKSDVRVIATTSEDLDRFAARERLRSDLLLAVNIVQIEDCRRCKRVEDIRLLADRFRAACARASHRAITGFTNDAMEAACWLYPWHWQRARVAWRGGTRGVLMRDRAGLRLEHLPAAMLCRADSSKENLDAIGRTGGNAYSPGPGDGQIA